MRRALQLARLGAGRVSPNPMVGCVIVHQDKIIGEGYHARYGENHAEVNAINSVHNPDLLPESTVYVNLEPCAHYGNTPPCVDLLIEKNVNEVVIASTDPNPKVDGRGITKLFDAGIKVESGVLKAEADELNTRFMTFHRKKRPYVILKWAQTGDGYIARTNYDSKWISNPHARQLVHKWRTEEDAILVGYNTARYDNPRLSARNWAGKNPVRVVLDPKLELNRNLHLFDRSVTTYLLNYQKERVDGNLHYIKVNSKDLIKSIIDSLYKRDTMSVIVEGGTQLLQRFVDTGLWDEARVFYSKKGFGEGIPAPVFRKVPVHEENIMGNRLAFFQNENIER